MKVVIKEWLKVPKACFILLGSFIASIIYTILSTRVMIVIKDAMEHPKEIVHYLIIVGCVYLALIIINALWAKLRQESLHYTYSVIRDKYNNKILDGDVAMYTKYSPAHIQTVSDFVHRIVRVGVFGTDFIRNMISMVVTLYYMYIVAGNMIIPVLVIYVIGGIGLKALYKSFSKIDNEADKIRRERDQEMEDVVCGFIEVRSFWKIDHHKKRLHDFNYNAYSKFSSRSTISLMICGFIQALDALGLLLILVYSTNHITAGTLTAAGAMTLVAYVLKLADPLSMALDFIDDLSQNLSMSDQYEEIINYINQVDDNGTISLSEFTDSIKIENVSFSYGDSKDVLQNISMEIKKGQKIGICGISGGGKSTLFKLLNRFYNVNDGSISIDGFNINDITLKSYRKIIGSVHQDNYIFPGTIKENIVYGVSSYTEEEFLSACRKANVYNFAMEQENKFDTVVGPRGLKLSGGQKQRIALARLLLMNPEVILLDEATSSLDNESEFLIQDAIDNLGDKTIISIAHRLSTIKNCDKIYVMGKNCIIEEGTHDELMDMNGEYAKMVHMAEKRERRGA